MDVDLKDLLLAIHHLSPLKGQVKDFYFEGYGWVIKDGEVTGAGNEFYEDYLTTVHMEANEQ